MKFRRVPSTSSSQNTVVASGSSCTCSTWDCHTMHFFSSSAMLGDGIEDYSQTALFCTSIDNGKAKPIRTYPFMAVAFRTSDRQGSRGGRARQSRAGVDPISVYTAVVEVAFVLVGLRAAAHNCVLAPSLLKAPLARLPQAHVRHEMLVATDVQVSTSPYNMCEATPVLLRSEAAAHEGRRAVSKKRNLMLCPALPVGLASILTGVVSNYNSPTSTATSWRSTVPQVLPKSMLLLSPPQRAI